MVLVAVTFSLNATMQEKEAKTTSGMFGFHPGHVSDKGRAAPFRITPSMPLTQLGQSMIMNHKVMTLLYTGSSSATRQRPLWDNHL